MTLTPLVLAIRAVSAEFARRVYVPVVCIAGGVALALIIVLIWLTTLSGWWWLLLAPVILFVLAGIIVALVSGLVIKLVNPAQNKEQRGLVKSLVDEIQKTSEVIQTPKFIILFRLVKDIAFPGKTSYISELSATAASLKRGLQNIITSFQK